MKHLKTYKLFEMVELEYDDIHHTLMDYFQDFKDEDDFNHWRLGFSKWCYRITISPSSEEVTINPETGDDDGITLGQKFIPFLENIINWMESKGYTHELKHYHYWNGKHYKADLKLDAITKFELGYNDYFQLSFLKDNQLKTESYKKFYESIGSPLLDLSNNVDRHLISQIQKSVKPADSILEISCGNGSDSLQLQELGFKVTCTELNPEYVQNAKDLGLNCIQHNTKNKFPFSDKEFDLIYSRLGLHYFTEEELNSIFSELQRIGKKILITVKVVDDIKTGKVILTEEKWKEIVNRFFNIKSFEVKEGQLYGSQSKWIEIGGESLEKTFEARVYQLSLVDGRSEIQEDMELMKDMLSDIEDFEDLGVHIKNWLDYIDIRINKDNWYKGNEENTFKLTENIHKVINRFRKYFRSLGYSIQMYRTNCTISDGNSNHERLWISDDDFLDDDHKRINNKEVLRIQIRLT